MEHEQAIFELLRKYFQQYDVSTIQKQSYNHFLTHRLPKIIEEEPIIQVALKKNEFICVEFGQVFVDKPYIIDEKRIIQYILPSEALLRDLTYSSVFSVNISTKHFLVDDDNVETILEEKNYIKIPIARIPMMVGCSKCNLSILSKEQQMEKGQCENDPGGYFIIKGKERVLVAQERINYNHVYVFEKRTSDQKHLMVSEIRSMSDETGHSVLIQMKICVSMMKVVVSIPFISQDIPLGFIFMAYGCSPEQVAIILQKNIRQEFLASVDTFIENIIKDVMIIQNEENAIQYIAQYATHVVSKERRYAYVKQILVNEVFPHLGISNDEKQKIYYLGHMCGKLLTTFIGKRPLDDRDHLANKRIEVSGILVGDLFRTLWKRFIRTIVPQLMKRSDIITIISKINVITMGLRHCFATGNWGIPKSNYIRTGVSQVLSRLSYNSSISHLRRIVIPIGKEGKNTKIRQVHPTQIGFVCSSETPEGCSAGIVKNFSLIAEVSLGFDPLYIRMVLENIPSIETNFDKFLDYDQWHKVFLNGNWIGIMKDIPATLQSLHSLKYEKHAIPDHTSFVFDGELKLFCDEGRMIRPLFDARRMPSPEDLTILSWDQLTRRGNIKWVDVHEIEYKELVMYPHEITQTTDYCEIHPCLLLGICSSMMPYADHTQSPRICYHASMVKQSIGIYSSTNEIRSDTVAHLLCYPEKPLVRSHVEEWMKMDNLPCGNNVIVAIACYGGWNQEDSIILNKSSVDRGLFRSFTYRTLVVEEKKKTSTHFETIEMPSADVRIRSFHYNKLDSNGIIRLGTFVGSGDVIVGKVSTRQIKIGKEEKFDTSVIIKNGEEGFVDKVFITTTPDGYKMIKVKIRCLKIPEIGDKLCSNCAQKGTIGMTLPREDMPYTLDGIVPDIIINPLCFTRDTRVHCVDGLSRRLDSVLGYLDHVWSFNVPQQQLVYGKSMGGEFKAHTSIVRLVKSDGRTICCTPDHLFLVYHENNKQSFSWKQAQHLLPTDRVVCGMECPEDYELLTDFHFFLKIDQHFFRLKTIEQRLATMALFRLVGFFQSMFHHPLIHWKQIDTSQIWQDMEKMPVSFSISFLKNLDMLKKLHEIPLCLVREYIASFLSLSLCWEEEYVLYAKWDKEKMEISILSTISFLLLTNWGIQCSLVEKKNSLYLVIHSIGLFQEYIGIRYYPLQSLRLTVVSSYWRHSSDQVSWKEFLDHSHCSTWWYQPNLTNLPFWTCSIVEKQSLPRKEDTFCIGVETHHNFIAEGLVVKNCIPSRMTINQLMESIGAKSAAIRGKFRYATTFSKESVNIVETLKSQLQQCGYEKNGNEFMINGMTGQRLESEIFIGPSYYHRLKHLVSAKIHARNHGKVSQLTRQPLEGRSNLGGLRVGEMERDCSDGMTPISLKCGLSIRIDEMATCNDLLL
jgi:DNA-directed RNA polymerase II subunit RPB2